MSKKLFNFSFCLVTLSLSLPVYGTDSEFSKGDIFPKHGIRSYATKENGLTPLSLDDSNLNIKQNNSFSIYSEISKNYDSICNRVKNTDDWSELTTIAHRYLGQRAHYGIDNKLYSKGRKNTCDDSIFQGTKDYVLEELSKLKSDTQLLKRIKGYQIDELSKENGRPTYWNSGVIQPNQTVYFIHGGGLQYLLRFLNGEEYGYKLEGKNQTGKGIQVHPFLTEKELKEPTFQRVYEYARSRSFARFDFPAYLTAKIQAKYLDSAPNLYEAGLRSMFLNKLEEPSIFIMGFNKNDEKYSGRGFTHLINSLRAEYVNQNLMSNVLKINRKLDYLDLAIDDA